jgi:CO/xanthine dehydrogenase FAD-binding subunit
VRLPRVEQAVVGAAQSEDTALRAGNLAIEGTRPLPHNEYKQPLMRNLVRRALRA